MRDLDRALADITAIRSQMARGTEFRGYGPVTMAATPAPSPAAPPPLARRPPQQFRPGEPGWWQASDGY